MAKTITVGNVCDWDAMKKCGMVNPRALIAAEETLFQACDRLNKERA